jgi:hypothetical protein
LQTNLQTFANKSDAVILASRVVLRPAIPCYMYQKWRPEFKYFLEWFSDPRLIPCRGRDGVFGKIAPVDKGSLRVLAQSIESGRCPKKLNFAAVRFPDSMLLCWQVQFYSTITLKALLRVAWTREV